MYFNSVSAEAYLPLWRDTVHLFLAMGHITHHLCRQDLSHICLSLRQKKIFFFKVTVPLLGIYPRDTGVLMYRGTCTPMFIAALSTIAKLWKEAKCPSTDKWVKKMWFTYTMKYYLAMRKNELWPFAATWMELEGIMLSEIRQSEKDRYHMFSLM